MADPELGQLAEINAARAGLDERELELIDRARQAAEQRRQRLVAAARSRRHDQDLRYAHSIVTLRMAVDDLHRSIAADRRWTDRFPRAALVRATVQTALDAPPGGLYALAAQTDADLATAPLPGFVRVAATALRRALSTPR